MTPPTTDIEYLESLVAQKVTDSGAASIAEAIHGRRIMPAGTPLPGIVDVYRTPYLMEPMENMSPSSPVRRTTIMKSVQSAVTWFAECVIAAWQLHWPTKMLYLTSVKDGLPKWTKRLEPLIDSMGLRERIVSDNTDRKTRTTGDKALSKTFKGGGALEMGSLRSPSDLASDSIQVAIADEVDRAPEMLTSGEGNFLRVLAGRLEAFLWKAKLLAFSTPTTWDASLIWREFKLGDQREYFVPCKHCGHMFYMEFKHLIPVFDKETKLLESVWLKCPAPECGGKHVNSDKTWMLAPENGAEWRPQAVPSMKNHRSYHISKMMVPVGLSTWTNIYQEYLNAKELNDMAPFFNLQLGLPFKPKGTRPNHNVVMEQRGPYKSREIPEGVLFLSCAMDVQQGSKTDPNKPPRLEMEVLGNGQEFRTWGIEYKVFTGRIWRIDKKTGESVELKGGAAEAERIDKDLYEVDYDLGIDNPYRGAWSEFHDWAVENFTYTRKDGMKFTPLMVFIDSSDGNTMQQVYAFCQRPEWRNTFPIKGTSIIRRKKKGETGDEVDDNSMVRYSPYREPGTGEIKYYSLSTWHYKAHLFNNLSIKRQPFDPQAPHFCDFPQDYTEKYFKQLTANERHPDGSYHDIGHACEALDVRVYALCAADVALTARMVYYRKKMLAGQAKRPANVRRSQMEIDQMIDIKYTLRMIERETAPKELK